MQNSKKLNCTPFDVWRVQMRISARRYSLNNAMPDHSETIRPFTINAELLARYLTIKILANYENVI